MVCIASGPSLTADDCQRVGRWKAQAPTPESRVVVVVNEAWRPCAGFADHLYAADGKWWRHITRAGITCRDEVQQQFPGRLWTCDIAAARDFGLELVGIRDEPGLNTEAGVVNTGGSNGGSNGGMQAVNLAWHLGADRIVLLGYDMQMQGDRPHFHGKHVNKLGDPTPSLMRRWAQAAAPVARDLIELGVEIVNCSRESAAQGWPRLALEDVLEPY